MDEYELETIETTTTTLLEGKIYSWTNTTAGDEYNWVYVGSTTHENNRKSAFLNLKIEKYAGKRINDARVIFGPSAFQYQVEETVEAPDEATLKQMMNEREAYYIKKYNSTTTGYNSAIYGQGQKGMKLSEETRKKMSDSHKKIAVKVTHQTRNISYSFQSMKLASTTLSIPLSTMHNILANGGGEWKNYKITAA